MKIWGKLMTTGKITIECGEHKAVIFVKQEAEDKADVEIKLEPALNESDNSPEANFIRANLWLFVNFARG